MRHLLAPLLGMLLVLPAAARAAPAAPDAATPAPTTWMAVLLDGHQIGSLRIDRDYTSQTITTTQTLAVELNRARQPLHLRSMSRTVESIDGRPLDFSASSALSSVANTVHAQQTADRRFRVTSSTGGISHQREILLDQDVLLFEGQRRAMLAAAHAPGSHYRLRLFDPASQQARDVEIEVIGDEPVQLPEGTMTLSHQRQRQLLAGNDQVMDLWLDGQGIARKGEFRLLGRRVQIVSCSKACALAPAQRVDLFQSTIVDSPRPLPPPLRTSPLTYRMHLRGDFKGRLVQTDEQRIRRAGDHSFFVDIGPASPGGQPGPTPADTAATAWLQSDAPAIRQLAEKVAGNAVGNRNKMRRLRSFVSDYVTGQDLDVGYASAMEVLQNRKGDCTEYAVLLAALARAQGVPTRVVSGMVYADRYAGTFRVFVPHAWVQSWVDGRWESYDAALRRFDATHIALSTGDGDPGRYFSATQWFGQLSIDNIVPSDAPMKPASPPTPPAAAGGD